MSKSNFDHNYPALIDFLAEKDYEYYEFQDGQQVRIMGPISIVDVWPARMSCHIVASESPVSQNKYFRLDYNFNPKQVEHILTDRDLIL